MSESPSVMFWKSDCTVEFVTVLQSMTNGAEAGVVSEEVQFGPREPMNAVEPQRVLFSTVKFREEDIPMA